MAYYLQFDGSDDYVSLASAISVNWGTDAYVFEFTANIKTWPSSANAGIIGSTTSSTTGITLRSFSPVNSLSVLSSGSLRFDSGADFIIIGEKHTYRLEHDANGDYRWLRDGVLFSSGNFTTSTPATVQAIGQARSVGLWTHMDLYRLTFVSGFSNNPDYYPSLSGGNGTTLNDTNGLNNGTLVNGPVFVFYESGEPEPAQVYELTATGGTFTLTGSQANAAHSRIMSASGAEFSVVGGAASLIKNSVIIATGADISYSGANAELTYSQSATVYEMIATGAEISFTVDDVALTVNRLMSAAGAEFNYQGLAAGTLVNRSMLVGGALISCELSGAELIRAYTLTADGGSYSLSGGLAQLNYSAAVNMSIVDYSAVYCPYIAQAEFAQSGSAQFADRQTSATFSN